MEHICPVLAVCFFKSVWFQLFSRMHLLRYPQDLGNQCVEKGCGKGWTEAARAHVVFKSVQKCSKVRCCGVRIASNVMKCQLKKSVKDSKHL